MLDPESAWKQFQAGIYGQASVEGPPPIESVSATSDRTESECSPLYISTKTKIGYLNQSVPLALVFWKVPVIPYHLPREGVIKKQMKFNCTKAADLANLAAMTLQDKLASGAHLEEHVISHIENPGGRIPFRDVRKISLGLCRKDVASYRSKKKGAFYNCFVVILRLKWEKRYKEIHIKVFNTGKLEIPGIRDERLLTSALSLLTATLDPLMPPGSEALTHLPEKSETVLVNSNFTCNYYLDRQALFDLLRTKYGIACSYDPCSYPGIQAEFYYDPDATTEQTGRLPPAGTAQDLTSNGSMIKVSFMIFRTGSVLIVGKCTDPILANIYRFICKIMLTERESIMIPSPKHSGGESPPRKPRKRTITVHGSCAPATSSPA